jgi:hypothetical protein
MKISTAAVVLALAASLLAACKDKSADNASTSSPQATQPGAPASASQPGQPAQAGQPGQTAPAPPPQPAPAPQPVIVPAGTILTVRLVQQLSSKTNSQGDPYDATLAAPLAVDGITLAPVGTRVSGVVIDAHKAGHFKGGATLDLALRSLIIKGKVYRISTMTMNQTSKGKGKRTAAMVGGGAGGGALIGGIAGGGKGAAIGALVGGAAGTAGAGLTGNRDIVMESESEISFQMSKSLTLDPGSVNSSQP